MKLNSDYKLYNMILPTFMLFIFIPHLWAISLAGNFVIDSIILIIISLIIYKKVDWKLYKKTIIKVWLLGFVSDFIGVFYLILFGLCTNAKYYAGSNIFKRMLSGIYMAVNHSPYDSIWGIAFIISGILISAICIFIFDYFISFKTVGFSKKQRLVSALAFAIATAPYTFLLPKEIFY